MQPKPNILTFLRAAENSKHDKSLDSWLLNYVKIMMSLKNFKTQGTRVHIYGGSKKDAYSESHL